jgi:hypothetical protein
MVRRKLSEVRISLDRQKLAHYAYLMGRLGIVRGELHCFRRELADFQLGWLTRLGRRARRLIVVPAFVTGAGKYRQARILRKSRVALAELTEPEHGPFARLNYL